jgi:hypothetical protein
MHCWQIDVPIFDSRQEDRKDANPWQQYWGESYGQELKRQLLKPIFDKLEIVTLDALDLHRSSKVPAPKSCRTSIFDPPSAE